MMIGKQAELLPFFLYLCIMLTGFLQRHAFADRIFIMGYKDKEMRKS